MTYEGMRSIAGPYLAVLGASGAAVGLIGGIGELSGYVLRLVSGSVADRSRLYWPITITGYIVQMAAVPALALVGSWPAAAALIIIERIGKATRNPPRDVMLARAGESIGHGWAFGLHEALDQSGAVIGPLLASLVLAHHGDYRAAFAWFLVPAVCTVSIVFTVRLRFPTAGTLKSAASWPSEPVGPLPSVFWIYAAGAGLVGFGFADYTLIAYHYTLDKVMSSSSVPVLYALAMGAGGLGSVIAGRSYDRYGIKILIPATLLIAAYAPLVFWGGFELALVGTVLWGLGVGVHETVMSATIATLVPSPHRARAYGIFTTIFGIAWFAGSATLGELYDRSLAATIVVAVVAQLLGVVPIAITAMKIKKR
jgi:predicted MFS family arabinose efflux permease